MSAQVLNLVSGTLSAADQTAVLAALQTIRAKLPFLHDLTPDERRSLAKMGDKSRAFVSKVLEASTANPQSLPASFNLAEYQKDNALYLSLLPVAAQIAQLAELVDDTMVALGADLYSESLAAYGMLKASGVGTGLDEAKASMAQRFRRNKPAETPAPSPAPNA